MVFVAPTHEFLWRNEEWILTLNLQEELSQGINKVELKSKSEM